MASSLYMSPCCSEVEPCQDGQNQASPALGDCGSVAQTSSDLGPAVTRHLAVKFPGCVCLRRRHDRKTRVNSAETGPVV